MAASSFRRSCGPGCAGKMSFARSDLLGVWVFRCLVVWCLVFCKLNDQAPNTKHQTPNTKHQTPNLLPVIFHSELGALGPELALAEQHGRPGRSDDGRVQVLHG